jgi:hypothetical protein
MKLVPTMMSAFRPALRLFIPDWAKLATVNPPFDLEFLLQRWFVLFLQQE